MENARLNKELAEWVGLNPVLCWGYRKADGRFVASPPEFGKAEFDGFDIDDTEQSWCFLHPDYRRYVEIPDFANSLDACFEHLAPVLREKALSLRLITYVDGRCRCDIESGYGTIPDISVLGETPALALCSAIKELKDKRGAEKLDELH